MIIKNVLSVMAVVIALCFCSCVSVQKNMVRKRELAEMNVIGHVNMEYTSYQPIHLTSGAEKKAYKRLLKIARAQYGVKDIDVDDIDIVNVQAKGGFSGYQVPLYVTYLYFGMGLVFGNFQRVNATADVILLDSSLPDRSERTYAKPESAPAKTYAAPTLTSAGIDTRRLEKAIESACVSVLRELPPGSKVAIASVIADNAKITSLAIDVIEFKMSSDKRFDIMDRSSLDAIRKEHGLQASGEFDEKTLVEFGRLSGAGVIVVGNVMENRFSLKAMNGKTGKIMTMARESY